MSDNRYILIVGKQSDTRCFVIEAPDIPMAIYKYYIDCGYGKNDMLYKICLNSNIFSVQEIIEYVANQFDYDEEIREIYLLGEKVYG